MTDGERTLTTEVRAGRWVWLNLLALLGGPVAIAVAILAGYGGWSFQIYLPAAVDNDYVLTARVWTYGELDARLEEIAVWLAMIPVAVYMVRSILTRNPLYIVLTILTASLLCREIHFTGMDKGIYVMAVVVVVWAIVWRDWLAEPLKTDRPHTIWLVSTILMYALSQMIAKRWFKFISGEQAIHTQVEEVAETMGHVMMIVTCLVGRWGLCRWVRKAEGDAA